MKKIYVTAALAVCLTTAAAQAQQAKKGAAAGKQARETELKQEITLEKDFVPVEKKATKKNALPRVKKAAATQKVTLNYSAIGPHPRSCPHRFPPCCPMATAPCTTSPPHAAMPCWVPARSSI